MGRRTQQATVARKPFIRSEQVQTDGKGKARHIRVSCDHVYVTYSSLVIYDLQHIYHKSRAGPWTPQLSEPFVFAVAIRPNATNSAVARLSASQPTAEQ